MIQFNRKEYEELTNKLHTFLAREQVLKEKINEFTTDLYNGSSEFESPPPDNSANFQSLSDGSPRPTPRSGGGRREYIDILLIRINILGHLFGPTWVTPEGRQSRSRRE